MLRPDKSVMILELKIHFPNYKILGKKYDKYDKKCDKLTYYNQEHMS